MRVLVSALSTFLLLLGPVIAYSQSKVSWAPQNPSKDDTITITFSNTTIGAKLHWGVNNTGYSWQRPDSVYWPEGTNLYSDGTAVQTIMAGPQNGKLTIKLGPFNNPKQEVARIAFVFQFSNGSWDNNSGKDYHIRISNPGANILSSFTLNDRSVALHLDTTTITLMFLSAGILRVQYLPARGSKPDSSFTVLMDTLSALIPSVEETQTDVTFSAGFLRVLCKKNPFSMTMSTTGGRVLTAHSDPLAFESVSSERILRFAFDPRTVVYGSGARPMSLDLNGYRFNLYNIQSYGYNGSPFQLNINVPLLLTSNGYGLFFDNTYPGIFDIGATTSSVLEYLTTGGEVTYYLLAADTYEDQLRLYHQLTGRQKLPPRWAFGFIQSKFGYRNETEARTAVSRFRQKNIPLDALIIDLYWFNQMGDLAWNLSAFPDPQGMMSDFHSQGVKTVVITEPYVTQNSLLFSEGTALGHFAKNTQGNPYLLSGWWSCNCSAALVDMSSPAARAWWWSKHPLFFGENLAGIWTDLGEPETHPSGMIHHLGSAAKVHNIYNLLWAQLIQDGFRLMRPGKRLFNLTRSGFAGLQATGAVTWSGDVAATWEGLRAQIPMMLNMSMSGLSYHHSDLGGFAGTPSNELFIRWMQLGVFSPVMRAHGARTQTEPWSENFGSQAEIISRTHIVERYRLLPYIYSVALGSSLDGGPVTRPLSFIDATLSNERQSFLFGGQLLISPVVTEGATTKTIPLPAGNGWFDHYSNIFYEGGQTITYSAPLTRLPVLVKEGCILPTAPPAQSTSAQTRDTLILAVFPHRSIDTHFELLEDNGETYAYEQGTYAVTRFSHRQPAADNLMFTLSVDPVRSLSWEIPSSRLYRWEVRSVSSPPSEIVWNSIPLQRRTTLDQLLQSGGYFHDALAKLLYVQHSSPTDTSVKIEARKETTAVADDSVPTSFTVRQNYPNPFNPSTSVPISLPATSFVRITILDLLGRTISVPVERNLGAGNHTIHFSLFVPSGAYFYRVDITPAAGPSHTFFKRMLLAK